MLSPVPDASDSTTATQQQEKEALYRQLLAQGVLTVLLPTEDLENVCLRTLVGDILADLVLGELVCEKASQGWFVWETITKIVNLLKRDERNKSEEKHNNEKSRLERFGLLDTGDDNGGRGTLGKGQSNLAAWIWGFLQCCFLAYVSIRFVITGLFRVASSSTHPSREPLSASTPSTPINPPREAPSWSTNNVARPPVLKYRVFSMVSQLIDVPRRMPWLGGNVALIQHALLEGPWRFGETDGILDR